MRALALLTAKLTPGRPVGGPIAVQKTPQIPLSQRLDPVHRLGEEELFLEVRREQSEVHELRDPGPGEPEPTGHFSAVADAAAVDGVLDLVREHHTTQP